MPDGQRQPGRIIQGSIVEGGHVVDDAWTMVDEVDRLRMLPDDASVIVPSTLWSADRDELLVHKGPIGIRLEPDDDPAAIADDLGQFELVAVHFPKFTDGRGYSIARLLRERHGYGGPLRAVGDVLRDQLFYMLRCGFDQFAMKHDDQIEAALSAYRDFTDAYQTAVDRREPSFARRTDDRAGA